MNISHNIKKREGMHDPFDRRVDFIGVALVFGRLKNSGKVWDIIQPQLDHLLRSNNLFAEAPFLWVGINYRYGIKNDLQVEFTRPHKKYGDVGASVELNMEILMWADKNNVNLLRDIFMVAALEALIQVCKKYKLPKVHLIEEERAKYHDIPNTIEEAQAFGEEGLLKE